MTARLVAARVSMALAVVTATFAVVAAIAPTSFAADGPQPAPSLEPTSVSAPTDAFTLRAPGEPGATRCEEGGEPRTGETGWRWHSFIVEAGRDASTLRFTAFGPGEDYDASDGTITAPLLTAGGEGVWQKIPGLEPEGQINPDELAGLLLDPTVYTLPDGEYQIGFACTDEANANRQWWALRVTISSSAPFMTATATATSAAAAPDTSAPAAADEGSGAVAPEPTTTTTTPRTAAATGAAAEPGDGTGASAATGDANAPRDRKFISWAPLASVRAVSGRLPVLVWALLALLFARFAYLLSRPVRTRSLERRDFRGALFRRNATMNGIRARHAIAIGVVAVLGSLLPLSLARAADGPQSPNPILVPSAVASATTPFAMDVPSEQPGSVSCDGTGPNGWRMHTFAVQAGVNLANLDFTQDGLPPGWVGADFDATDGSLAGPLFVGGEPSVAFPPSATPAGLIDPAWLAGFTFDPSFWTFVDGNYQIGFACTDAENDLRQWWAVTVAIDANPTSGSFMVVAGQQTATTTTTPGSTTPTTGGTTTTTTATTTPTTQPTTTTTRPATATTTTVAGAGASTATTFPTGTDSFSSDSDSFDSTGSSGSGEPLPTTGASVLLYVVLAAALCYLGRVLWLFGRSHGSASRS